jgi:hypothetical protein
VYLSLLIYKTPAAPVIVVIWINKSNEVYGTLSKIQHFYPAEYLFGNLKQAKQQVLLNHQVFAKGVVISNIIFKKALFFNKNLDFIRNRLISSQKQLFIDEPKGICIIISFIFMDKVQVSLINRRIEKLKSSCGEKKSNFFSPPVVDCDAVFIAGIG